MTQARPLSKYAQKQRRKRQKRQGAACPYRDTVEHNIRVQRERGMINLSQAISLAQAAKHFELVGHLRDEEAEEGMALTEDNDPVGAFFDAFDPAGC